MEENINVTSNKTKMLLKQSFKYISNFVIYGAILVISFILGQKSDRLVGPNIIESPLEEVKNMSQTSVAVNERLELLIIDRNTGKYKIYCDSVGLAIFEIYANRIYKENIK